MAVSVGLNSTKEQRIVAPAIKDLCPTYCLIWCGNSESTPAPSTMETQYKNTFLGASLRYVTKKHSQVATFASAKHNQSKRVRLDWRCWHYPYISWPESSRELNPYCTQSKTHLQEHLDAGHQGADWKLQAPMPSFRITVIWSDYWLVVPKGSARSLQAAALLLEDLM